MTQTETLMADPKVQDLLSLMAHVRKAQIAAEAKMFEAWRAKDLPGIQHWGDEMLAHGQAVTAYGKSLRRLTGSHFAAVEVKDGSFRLRQQSGWHIAR